MVTEPAGSFVDPSRKTGKIRSTVCAVRIGEVTSIMKLKIREGSTTLENRDDSVRRKSASKVQETCVSVHGCVGAECVRAWHARTRGERGAPTGSSAHVFQAARGPGSPADAIGRTATPDKAPWWSAAACQA